MQSLSRTPAIASAGLSTALLRGSGRSATVEGAGDPRRLCRPEWSPAPSWRRRHNLFEIPVGVAPPTRARPLLDQGTYIATRLPACRPRWASTQSTSSPRRDARLLPSAGDPASARRLSRRDGKRETTRTISPATCGIHGRTFSSQPLRPADHPTARLPAPSLPGTQDGSFCGLLDKVSASAAWEKAPRHRRSRTRPSAV